MISNLKTLIVFDTNKLRSTIRGGTSYGSFEFSNEFNEISSFINEKKLSEFVDIAIPRIVIEELLKQKIEQYEKDIEDYSAIVERLSMLPNTKIDKIVLPDKSFDCSKNLKEFLEQYVKNNNIILIELQEDKLIDIFKNVINRAIQKQSPFNKEKSDAGFKDAIIWESILNYEKLDEYNKVIFVTKDSGFDNNCISEFESKIQKYIKIVPSIELVIQELNKDYEFYIQHYEVIDFANEDYFMDYLNKEISDKKYILIDDKEYLIENFKIIDYCDAVLFDFEGEAVLPDQYAIIFSIIDVYFKKNNAIIKENVLAQTFITDSFDIIMTDLGTELI
jgi:hypothetical protein